MKKKFTWSKWNKYFSTIAIFGLKMMVKSVLKKNLFKNPSMLEVEGDFCCSYGEKPSLLFIK